MMKKACGTILVAQVAAIEDTKVGRVTSTALVEENFPQENFRVFSEMRILAKIRLGILDFVR